MKNVIIFAAGAALLVAAQSSFANTQSGGTLNYSITIVGNCTVTSTSIGGGFGMYGTTHADLTNQSAGSIAVLCPTTLPYQVLIDGGQDPVSGTTRRMTYDDGTTKHYIAYNLKYSGTEIGDSNPVDTSYTSPNNPAGWANGLAWTASAAGEVFPLTSDVKIASMSPVPVGGIYTDTVAVTVAW